MKIAKVNEIINRIDKAQDRKEKAMNRLRAKVKDLAETYLEISKRLGQDAYLSHRMQFYSNQLDGKELLSVLLTEGEDYTLQKVAKNLSEAIELLATRQERMATSTEDLATSIGA